MTISTQKPLNAYEQKQADRKARFEELAQNAADKSAAFSARASDMAQAIPFGQPILVGHHSERSDRAYRGRISRNMDKACTEMSKAEYYENKAAAVGRGGISSDDPDAIEKLQKQLDAAVKTQELMKAANKAIRASKTPDSMLAALLKAGLSETVAAEIMKPNHFGRLGFESYQLTNNNANIRRIKNRIKQLQATASRETVETQGVGYIYREDVEENRVMFEFDGKPDEATRTTLKRNGFKWSPSRTAWVRQLNAAGIHAGKAVQAALASE